MIHNQDRQNGYEVLNILNDVWKTITLNSDYICFEDFYEPPDPIAFYSMFYDHINQTADFLININKEKRQSCKECIEEILTNYIKITQLYELNMITLRYYSFFVKHDIGIAFMPYPRPYHAHSIHLINLLSSIEEITNENSTREKIKNAINNIQKESIEACILNHIFNRDSNRENENIMEKVKLILYITAIFHDLGYGLTFNVSYNEINKVFEAVSSYLKYHLGKLKCDINASKDNLIATLLNNLKERSCIKSASFSSDLHPLFSAFIIIDSIKPHLLDYKCFEFWLLIILVILMHKWVCSPFFNKSKNYIKEKYKTVPISTIFYYLDNGEKNELNDLFGEEN